MSTLPTNLDGQLEPVATIAQKRTGKRPSRPTVWRWIKKGVCQGVTLDAVHAGQWMTTAKAFDDFLARQTEAMLQPRKNTLPTATDDSLRAAGLL